MVLLALLLALGYVLARILSLHAGWLGRRWANRLSDELSEAVGGPSPRRRSARSAVSEEARTNLATAWREAGSTATAS